MIIIPSLKIRPATSKVSFSKFKDIGVSPGSWVEIYTDSSQVDSILNCAHVK